jgi:hypothetical protein
MLPLVLLLMSRLSRLPSLSSSRLRKSLRPSLRQLSSLSSSLSLKSRQRSSLRPLLLSPSRLWLLLSLRPSLSLSSSPSPLSLRPSPLKSL